MLLAAVLCVGACAHAQDTSRGFGATILGDGRTFLRAAGFVFSAPARWEGRDWALAGGTVGATLASALLDNETLRLMDRNRTYPTDRLSDVVVRYGDAGYVLPATVAAYGAGLVFHDRWLRETAFLTASAILLSGTVSTVTKTIVGRGRPYLGLGNHLFKPFTVTDDDYLSFPSGHAIVAFSVSGVLARRFGNPWATAGLYLLAASTGWSRVYTLHHWLSDVLFSAAMATAVSGTLVSWFETGRDAGETSGLRILPCGNGFVVAWIF